MLESLKPVASLSLNLNLQRGLTIEVILGNSDVKVIGILSLPSVCITHPPSFVKRKLG